MIIYLFLLITALPLLSSPLWFSPPAWGQTVVFRIILSVILFFFLVTAARTRISIPKNLVSSPVFLPIALLLGVLSLFSLVTIFSLDSFFSFWGTPFRAWGFLNYLLYVVFALLTFFFLRSPKSWSMVWNAAFITGVFMCLLALAQQFGIKLGETFVLRDLRPGATLGSPIILALYLLMLSFPALSFSLSTSSRKKKILLASAFALFVFTLFFTLTRGAFAGFGLALLYFLFLYPKRVPHLKSFTVGLTAAAIVLLLFFHLVPQPDFVQSKQVVSGIWSRLQITHVANDPRFPGWAAELKAVRDRPILGYGLYNSSIGFDKYYTSQIVSATGWWDTAHNLFLDILLWSGVLGLLLFLLFIGVLLWRLHQVKQKIPEHAILAHGTIAAFIAYLSATFFAFDMFATYLLFFLLVGFAFYLISFIPAKQASPESVWQVSFHRKSIFLVLILGLPALVWFVYALNLKPLYLNKEIQVAVVDASEGRCTEAIERIEKLYPSNTYLDYYMSARYVDIIAQCARQDLSGKAAELLKENIRTRPFYTRAWISLAGYINDPQYLVKAEQLSPNRWQVYAQWAQIHRFAGETEAALEKLNQCIALNPSEGDCWWVRALYYLDTGDVAAAEQDLNTASSKGYFQTKESILQLVLTYDKLVKEYGRTDYYVNLIYLYARLSELEPGNFQYHAWAAQSYKELGEYGKARIEIEAMLTINPALRENADAFLQTLPPLTWQELIYAQEKRIEAEPNNVHYYLDLATLYKQLGNIGAARGTAFQALQINPNAEAEITAFLNTLPPLTPKEQIYWETP